VHPDASPVTGLVVGHFRLLRHLDDGSSQALEVLTFASDAVLALVDCSFVGGFVNSVDLAVMIWALSYAASGSPLNTS
jgi:hypothetical protein